MAAKDNKAAILKALEGFNKEVSILERDGVQGVVLADDKGNEIFVSIATIDSANILSGSGKSYTRASTNGFAYTTDGLGVSLNVIESVRKPRVKA